jgi:serralysin
MLETESQSAAPPPQPEQWCFAWMAEPKTRSSTERAAMLRGAKWHQGDRINISFLDGEPAVQENVKRVARQWTRPGLANLTLVFLNNTTATDIRISFQSAGSWSTIGTTCHQVHDMALPTMNFGWLNLNSSDEQIERVVLHEFGHALGLVHEHQNPANPITWNRQQVIDDLSGPPHNWSLEKIEHNMFEPYAKRETNFTRLDSTSIMMYPIPARWTHDGFSAGLNSKLSELDKQFIRERYP